MSSTQHTAPSAEVFTLPVETRTFSRFPDLSYDIRYMIWLKALSYERYIRIKVTRPPEDASPSRSYDIEFWDTEEQGTELTMHPLLYACSESRQIAKIFYRIQFSWEC